MNDLFDGRDEKDEVNLPHHELTRAIFGCCLGFCLISFEKILNRFLGRFFNLIGYIRNDANGMVVNDGSAAKAQLLQNVACLF